MKTTYALVISILTTLNSYAVPTTFFGEDLKPGEQFQSGLACDAFRNSFDWWDTDNLEDGPYNFTRRADGEFETTIRIGTLSTYELSGYIPGEPNARSSFAIQPSSHAISGYNVLESSSGVQANLTTIANGFGFYATGWGNESSHAFVTVTLDDGECTRYAVQNTVDLQGGGSHPSSSTFFWGLVDPEHLITGVRIETDAPWWDHWELDNWTTGTTKNVPEQMPLGASALVLGLVCLAGRKL